MNKKMIQLGETLATLFYPLVEVTLFSPTGEELKVINRLDKSKEWNKGEKSPYSETLSDGRRVKVSEIDLGEVVVRVRYDTTLFQNMQTQLSQLLSVEEAAEDPWEHQVENLVHQYYKEHQLTPEGASRQDKRELVYHLYQQGIFRYKDAANYVGNMLGLSRATVYNYLKWATTMAGISIHQIDAFTKKRFRGNPAGVVLDAAHLDEEMMRKITREMNLSETAFILPSQKGNFRLRYFTPTGDEVRFCGHSTVGSLYMLAHEKRYGVSGPGRYQFNVETLAGLLKMEIEIGNDDRVTIIYEAPSIDLVPSDFTHAEICQVLGIDLKLVDKTKPVMFEKNHRNLLMTLRSLKGLESLQIDLKQAETFAREHDIVLFGLLTPHTFDRSNDLHIRCFAPAIGIAEDPFTGSVLGGLADYAFRNGLIKGKKTTIGVEQGHFMKRPGSVRILREGKKMKIFAHAVHLFSTQIQLR